jgi:hypothetical protein
MRKASAPQRPCASSRPAREEDLDYMVVQDFEGEDVESAVAELRPVCEEHRRDSLAFYQKLGKLVAKHYDRIAKDRAKSGLSMYGSRFFRRLGKELNYPWQRLYDSHTLVKAYDDAKFSSLCKQPQITLSHAIQLAHIHDEKERTRLQQKVAKEGLSVRGLQDEILAKYGRQRRPGAGRPLTVPKNASQAVTHMLSQGTKFQKLNSQAWFGDAFDIEEAAGEIPADKLTEEFKTRVSQAADLYDELAETTVQNAKVLREIESDIEQRILEQARVEQEAAEEGELCPVG